jgi:16S rRNA processing protein RimM
MSDSRIVVGYVRRAHGIKGEVIVRSLSDDPNRYVTGVHLFSDETPSREYIIVRSRSHADGHLLQFDGIDDRTTAESLKGVSFTIDPSERRPLGDDEFWPDELVGLRVVDSDASELGTVTDIVLGEAQDRLVVVTPGGERVEVPFVSAIVGDIDEGTVHVDPPEGLFPR